MLMPDTHNFIAPSSPSRMTVLQPAGPARQRWLREGLAAAAGIIAALVLGAALLVLHVPVETVFVLTAITGIGGALVYEVSTRRHWERLVIARLDATSAAQDRVSREVARNGTDIHKLKDGLAETAAALDVQAARLPAAAASIETRMLNVIAQKLGAMGNPLSRQPKLTQDQRGDDFLDLELAPPARKSVPISKLEEALNPRAKKFSDAALGDMIRNAVRHERMDVYVQPIVGLPQRRPVMIELYGRIRARSGISLSAERYMRIAANDSLVPAIDQWMLEHCIRMLSDPLAQMPGALPCVLNIEAAALGDARFMKTLVGFLATDRAMARRLIFDLAQVDIDALDPKLAPVMQALTKLGVRFAMDSVRRRKVNIDRLRQLNIRYLKLDAAWLIREAGQQGGRARLTRLKRQLDSAGIDLIVERIETEDELRDLLDLSIDFGAGHLFAKPEHYGAWRERQAKPKRAA